MCSDKDIYAGLIASIHHTGLPQHRYGTLPAVPRRQDEHTMKFIRELESQEEFRELYSRQPRESFEYTLVAK